MVHLLISFCLSATACYNTAPMKFENMEDCFEAERKLKQTKQVGPNATACEVIIKNF